MYRLELSASVEEDIDKALTWYAEINPSLQQRFSDALMDSFNAIELHPDYYSYLRHPLRKINLHGFPYLIVYSIEGRVVKVLALFHHRQQQRL